MCRSGRRVIKEVNVLEVIQARISSMAVADHIELIKTATGESGIPENNGRRPAKWKIIVGVMHEPLSDEILSWRMLCVEEISENTAAMSNEAVLREGVIGGLGCCAINQKVINAGYARF